MGQIKETMFMKLKIAKYTEIKKSIKSIRFYINVYSIFIIKNEYNVSSVYIVYNYMSISAILYCI